MTLVLYLLFWLIGLGITSFTLIPVLIILAFGIPTTQKLEKLKLLKADNGIVKRELISLIILTVVFLAIIIITLIVYPNGLIGLLFGGCMVFIFGIGKIGRNEANISDYIETNKEYFLETLGTIKYVILGWK